MNEYSIKIGQHLKELRQLKRMTLRDVENRSGLSHSAIYNYENGRPIDIDKLVQILKAMNYDLIDFLSEIK